MRRLLLVIGCLWAAGAGAQGYLGDPRNPEVQRREQEILKEQDDKKERERAKESSANDAANYKQFMENQRRLQEKLSGDVARDRAAFLKRPPLAPERNPLLGRWRLDQAKKRPANALAELNAAISAPTCRAVFGDGIWDFRPQALWGHDAGIGESKLFDADYRSGGGLIGVLPRQGEGLFVFEVKGPDRIEERTSTRIGADACAFVRVRTPAAAAATAAVPPGAGAATAPAGGGIVDGAAFRCADGRLLHVSFCQGEGPDAQCKLSDLHLPVPADGQAGTPRRHRRPRRGL